MSRKRNLIPFVWLLGLGLYLAYIFSSGLTWGEALELPLVFLATHPLGGLLFVLLYALRPLSLIPPMFFDIAAGLLFGGWLGLLYALLGSNLGVALAYGLAYGFGSTAPLKENRWGRSLGRMRRNTFETTLLMRCLFVPYDLMNYGAGFLRVPFLPFMLGTVVGSLAGTLAFVLFGASAEGLLEGSPQFRPWVLVLSFAILVLSFFIARFLRRSGAAEGVQDV